MEEEEVNLWFEEKKEELLKSYLKNTDALLLQAEKDDEKKAEVIKKTNEQISALMKDYERKFIKESEAIRIKYDATIQKVRTAEKRKIFNSEKRKRMLAPLLFIWKILKISFGFIGHLLSNATKHFKTFYTLIFKAAVKRRMQKFSFFISDKLHPSKLFYTQNIWPVLHFLNTPSRILKLKLIKLMEALKELVKRVLSKSKEKVIKLVKAVSEKLKKLIEFFLKIMTKIIAIIKTIISYLMKVYKVIRINILKLFPKKEDT